MSPLCDGAGEAQRVSGHKKNQETYLFFATFLPSPVSNMRIPPKVVSMAVPDAGGKKGVAPLNKGLSPQVTGGGQTGFL